MGAPRIFSFQSVPHGLNYLTKADDTSGLVQSGKLSTDIDSQRLVIFSQEIKQCLTSLVKELQLSFEQTKFELQKLHDALKGRPIIYTGGGSTFAELRRAYQNFSVMLVDHSCWKKDSIVGREKAIQYCPLLSTVYGLAIYAKHDNIVLSHISSLFAGIRKADDHDEYENNIPKHSFHDDWRYKEYGVLG